MQSDAPSTTAVPPTGVFSNGQPLQNLAALSAVSLGLYPTYWLYRNLKALRAHKGLSISPGWRTFGAFLPLIGLPLFKDQLQLFAETVAAAGVQTSFSPWGRTLGFAGVLTLTELLPDPWFLLSAGAVIFLLPVQQVLNEYWAIEQRGLPIRSGFTAGETALLIVGSLLTLLLLVLSYVGDRIVASG